jgi:hypothetical protein
MQIRLGFPGVREAKVPLRALPWTHAGGAPPQERAEPMQVEKPEENNDSVQQEGAGDNEDSILDNLSPLSGNASSIDSEEYNRLTKELEDKEKT